jgi:hypothetical protein
MENYCPQINACWPLGETKISLISGVNYFYSAVISKKLEILFRSPLFSAFFKEEYLEPGEF